MRIKSTGINLCWVLVFACIGIFVTPLRTEAQKFTDSQRQSGMEMLKDIKADLKKYYYDPTFHGMDLDARFKAAELKLKEVQTYTQMLSVIAQAVLELDDSHTLFIPPRLAIDIEYGWSMQTIGDKCYVVELKPGSDAATKGLRVGDEIYAIDGYTPTRENLWKIRYSYYQLRPRERVRLEIIKADGQHRELEIIPEAHDLEPGSDATEAYFKQRRDQLREELEAPDFKEFGTDLFVWKMRSFDLSNDKIDQMVKRLQAHKSAIIDLRGNLGGYERALVRMAGSFFDHDIKVAEVKRRKEIFPLIAKSRGGKAFPGQLVVLVDSRSASASEAFARLVQLNRRGTVVGDHTAGRLTRAIVYRELLSNNTILVPFGTSITDAELIMTDGQSLEHKGVVPDQLILPNSADLAANRDPVLSRAAALLGVEIDPQQAGGLFQLPKNHRQP
jgi:C-terminal processing protease CtpA/Prc